MFFLKSCLWLLESVASQVAASDPGVFDYKNKCEDAKVRRISEAGRVVFWRLKALRPRGGEGNSRTGAFIGYPSTLYNHILDFSMGRRFSTAR